MKIILIISVILIASALINMIGEIHKYGWNNFRATFNEKNYRSYYDRQNRMKEKELPGRDKWNRPEPAPIDDKKI